MDQGDARNRKKRKIMLLSVLLDAAGNVLPAVTDLSALAKIGGAIGAGIGIGSIGKSAVDAIARQPEAGGDIRTSMILTAAFVEGVALFAVVVGLLAVVM